MNARDQVHADMAANEAARDAVRPAILRALFNKTKATAEVARMNHLLAEAGEIERRHNRLCPDTRHHGGAMKEIEP